MRVTLEELKELVNNLEDGVILEIEFESESGDDDE